jgi:hypothetical protein
LKASFSCRASPHRDMNYSKCLALRSQAGTEMKANFKL